MLVGFRITGLGSRVYGFWDLRLHVPTWHSIYLSLEVQVPLSAPGEGFYTGIFGSFKGAPLKNPQRGPFNEALKEPYDM